MSRDITKERWTDEKTKRFVSRYRDMPVLWNVNHEHYNQRSKKQEAFAKLMKEFNLSLNEVRNKIRIYRTTYAQELRKMTTNADYQPKLAWFQLLHDAFSSGQIKSFVKTPKKESKPYEIQIEYADEDEETDEMQDDNLDESQYQLKPHKNDANTLIITPYEDEYETVDEVSNKQDTSILDHSSHQELHQSTSSVASKPASSLSSNELFLKSLQSTLDNLPDDKNMRARIKIQEILYKIAYDID